MTVLGRLLRVTGAVIAGLLCIASLFLPVADVPNSLEWVVRVYPLALATLAFSYACLIGAREYAIASAAGFVGWTLATGWQGYGVLRKAVAGLDHITLGLAFFLVAALISLAKAGRSTQMIHRGEQS